MPTIESSVERRLNLVQLQQKEIHTAYSISILDGFIQLSFPLDVQSNIAYMYGASLRTLFNGLIILIVLGVLTVGIMQEMN